MSSKLPMYTIGHSTKSIEEFIDLLKIDGVTQLVDIRPVPRSRDNPQYEQTPLKQSLSAEGIDGIYMKDLGGLRPKVKGSVHMGWHNESFVATPTICRRLNLRQPSII